MDQPAFPLKEKTQSHSASLGSKGQILIEAFIAFLFAVSFLFLLQLLYLHSQKEIQKARLSPSSAKKQAPWFRSRL